MCLSVPLQICIRFDDTPPSQQGNLMELYRGSPWQRVGGRNRGNYKKKCFRESNRVEDFPRHKSRLVGSVTTMYLPNNNMMQEPSCI